jgi:hypothetical protein
MAKDIVTPAAKPLDVYSAEPIRPAAARDGAC